MEEHARFLCNSAYIGHWLQRADLVAGVHDRNQHGARPKRGPHVVRRDQAVKPNGEVGDFDSLAFQLLAGIQNGRVLDLARDDVPRAISTLAHGPEDRQVVGLRAAARENQIAWLAR